MPSKGKKSVTRELRMIIDAHEEAKIGLEGTENLSMPLREKKLISGALRKLVDALEGEKIVLNGIKRACRYP